MAILAECPDCHKRQSLRNRICQCGKDLVKSKRSERLQYWVVYRVPGGKQRWELIGDSINKARDAEGKRRSQKRENRIFDIKLEAKMTFEELVKWFFKLGTIKNLSSFSTLENNLKRFNEAHGQTIVGKIKPADLENYQAKRKVEGLSDKTVDDQIGDVKRMIIKAFDNDLVDGDTLKVFKRIRKLLKKNSNARKRILSQDEFNRLMEFLPLHSKWIVTTGYFTGMRSSEIMRLTWDKVSLKDRLIRLSAKDTKDKEARDIPICEELYNLLSRIPRPIKGGHVFYFGNKAMRPIKGNIRKGLEDACIKAGIPYGRKVRDGFTFHDLRHTFNTNMRKAGVQESVIMEITGHSTREMFDRYNTIDAEDRKEAVKRLEVFLKQETANVSKPLAEGSF